MPFYIVHFYPFFRCSNNEYENDQANDQRFDFEKAIYASEFSNNESTKDEVLPP